MRRGTRICKSTGSHFPLREAAWGWEGAQQWGGEAEAGGTSPVLPATGSQPLARVASSSSPCWAGRARGPSPPGRSRRRPDRRAGGRGQSQRAASRSRSEADDVFASGSAGAKPGRAGDVTARSRDHHSNKQTPLPLRARPAPPLICHIKTRYQGRARIEGRRG